MRTGRGSRWRSEPAAYPVGVPGAAPERTSLSLISAAFMSAEHPHHRCLLDHILAFLLLAVVPARALWRSRANRLTSKSKITRYLTTIGIVGGLLATLAVDWLAAGRNTDALGLATPTTTLAWGGLGLAAILLGGLALAIRRKPASARADVEQARSSATAVPACRAWLECSRTARALRPAMPLVEHIPLRRSLLWSDAASAVPPLCPLGATAEAGGSKPWQSTERMRLYRCRLDMRACHPASPKGGRLLCKEVSKPRSRLSREHEVDRLTSRRTQAKTT